jgi:hypothetical protein
MKACDKYFEVSRSSDSRSSLAGLIDPEDENMKILANIVHLYRFAN